MINYTVITPSYYFSRWHTYCCSSDRIPFSWRPWLGCIYLFMCLHTNMLFYANFCVTGQQDCSLVCWDRPVAYLSHSFHGIHHLCQANLDTRVEFHHLNWALKLLSRCHVASGWINHQAVLRAFPQVLKSTFHCWQMWLGWQVRPTSFTETRTKCLVAIVTGTSDGEKHLVEPLICIYTLYKIPISSTAVMQGDRKSGLAAGLFVLTSSAMCVGPDVSQSGTDTSEGDVKNVPWVTQL